MTTSVNNAIIKTTTICVDAAKIYFKIDSKRIIVMTANVVGQSVKVVFQSMLKHHVYYKIFKRHIPERLSKVLLKKIPGISLGIGVALGVNRLRSAHKYQDVLKAVGEVCSGAIACVPVYGTAGSLALDGVLVLHDVYDLKSVKPLSRPRAHSF